MIEYLDNGRGPVMSADMETVIREMIHRQPTNARLGDYPETEIIRVCNKWITGEDVDGDRGAGAPETRILTLPTPIKHSAIWVCRATFLHHKSPWAGLRPFSAGILYLTILERSWRYAISWTGKDGYADALRLTGKHRKDTIQGLLVELESEGLISRVQIDHPEELRTWGLTEAVRDLRRAGKIKYKKQGLICIPRHPDNWNWSDRGGMHLDIIEFLVQQREALRIGLWRSLKDI
jgi:hypothetical protein